jgi:hypothetical protein
MNGTTASIICSALIVAGCASSSLPPIDPMAIDYRQLARDHVRDHFPEASKIRDAQIAPPKSTVGSMLVDAEQTDYVAVCLRTKAKGGPTGTKDTVLLIRGNQVMDAQDGAAGSSFCKGAPFEPFPEITREA